MFNRLEREKSSRSSQSRLARHFHWKLWLGLLLKQENMSSCFKSESAVSVYVSQILEGHQKMQLFIQGKTASRFL